MNIGEIDLLLKLFYSFLIFRWICVCILCLVLKKSLKAEVQIENLGFFSCHGIKIVYPQFSLVIKTFSLRLANKESGVIFCFCLNGVDIVVKQAEKVANSMNRTIEGAQIQCHVPPQLAECAKRIGVKVNGLNVQYKLNGQDVIFLYATKFYLHFCQQDANQCVIAKAYLQMTSAGHERNTENQLSGSCSVNQRFILSSIAIEAVLLLSEERFSIQRLSVDINDLGVEIKEKLGVLIPGEYSQQSTTDLEAVEQSLEDVIYYFSPIIPKAFHLGICQIEVSGMKGTPSPYTLSIVSCTIDSTFKLPHIGDHSGNLDTMVVEPHVDFDFCLTNLDMEINLLEAIGVEELSAKVKLENKKLSSDVKLTSAAVDYHHEELMKWFKLNFNTPTSVQLDNLIVAQKNNFHSHCHNESFFSEVEVVVQIAKFAGKYYQSPSGRSVTASLDLNYTKLKFENSQGMRTNELRWSEIIVKDLWCYLGKMPSISISRRDRYHVWGSPLYIGVLVVKNPKEKLNNVEILLSSIQMEWSSGLPEVVLGAFRCMVDFQNIISDTFMNKEVKVKQGGKELPSYNISRTMKIIMVDCNVYFLQSPILGKIKNDSYFMLRFDNIIWESSSKKISYNVEGFKAIECLEKKSSTHPCTNYKQIKGYWLNIKKMNGESYHPFGEMNLQLQEEVNIFWNADLNSRLSEITSCVQTFCKYLEGIYPPSGLNNKKDVKYNTSWTVKANCPVDVVVDLFESTQLRIFACNAMLISTDTKRCIKAHIKRLVPLKGGLLGLNLASLTAICNNMNNGFMHFPQSNTSLYLSLECELQKSIQLIIFCEILAVLFFLI